MRKNKLAVRINADWQKEKTSLLFQNHRITKTEITAKIRTMVKRPDNLTKLSESDRDWKKNEIKLNNPALTLQLREKVISPSQRECPAEAKGKYRRAIKPKNKPILKAACFGVLHAARIRSGNKIRANHFTSTAQAKEIKENAVHSLISP